jgi:hypothetical protein
LNVHGVNDVRQTEIHIAGPLVPEPSASEVQLAIVKLRSHKSPGIDQITAELVKAGIRRNCLRSGRGRLWYLSIKRVVKHIVAITGAFYFFQLLTKHFPTSRSQG